MIFRFQPKNIQGVEAAGTAKNEGTGWDGVKDEKKEGSGRSRLYLFCPANLPTWKLASGTMDGLRPPS